ncbi:MAG TPA: ABC transporter ATP-binding protein, partial [Pontiella sp.]
MKTARRLLAYSMPYWPWLLLALTLILFTSLAVNFLPVLIQRITDDCLLNSEQPVDARISLLLKLGLTYIIIALVGHAVRYVQSMLTVWVGQKIIYDLRLSVFRKVLRMHQGYFDNTPVGTLMTRVTSDIERLQHFVTDGVVGSIADLFMIFGIMGYMVWFSFTLSLSIFATLPFLFAILYFINVKLRNANRDIRDRQSRLNALLQEDLTGMTTIQLFNREARALEDFDQRNTQLRSAYFDEVRWFSLYFPTIEAG